MKNQKLRILYRLVFPDDNLIEFPIIIDKTDFTFTPETEIIPQSWAALDYQQCRNCPLNKAASPYCPVAVNLTPVMDLCSSLPSYKSVKLEVVTAERIISGNTTMQRALSSIFGLVMAISPCPHTEYLKPMARFHLPLASEGETIYRATSMYLMAQYFRYKDGLDFSLDLDQLTSIYQNLQIINKTLAIRLRPAVTEDAIVNGVILLDLLSEAVTWSIDDGLDDFRPLFKSYGVKPSAGS